MTIDDAFKVLGIRNKNISSDELQEIYKVRLSQCSGFNKKKSEQQVRLAHQIVRNFRCAEDWKGASGSGMTSPNISNISDMRPKSDRSFLNGIILFFKRVLMVLGFIFLMMILYVLFN